VIKFAKLPTKMELLRDLTKADAVTENLKAVSSIRFSQVDDLSSTRLLMPEIFLKLDSSIKSERKFLVSEKITISRMYLKLPRNFLTYTSL